MTGDVTTVGKNSQVAILMIYGLENYRERIGRGGCLGGMYHISLWKWKRLSLLT
jgi:hypothetical protein